MKVVQHDIEKFVDIGTVVFYTQRDFFPEINGTVNGWRVDLAKSRVFMFSSEETSDQLDFAKYDFSYDLPKSDYWQRMDSNVFAYQDTTTQIGPDFDKYAKVLIPQDLGVSERDDEKKFFGRISTASETTYLVRIPKTIQTFSAGSEGNV
ncbi:MAG: hypothetical protein HUJ56_13440, partial [Erysipelotrichaceae bacterium]|nr:hypothetical protein [Erysipelotrichaceae bacterium]